jgi:hypothetical protein
MTGDGEYSDILMMRRRVEVHSLVALLAFMWNIFCMPNGD